MYVDLTTHCSLRLIHKLLHPDEKEVGSLANLVSLWTVRVNAFNTTVLNTRSRLNFEKEREKREFANTKLTASITERIADHFYSTAFPMHSK